jgi:hypothetical protein
MIDIQEMLGESSIVENKMTTKDGSEGIVKRQNQNGRLKIERVFSKPDVSPFDEVEWELRTARDYRRQRQGNFSSRKC